MQFITRSNTDDTLESTAEPSDNDSTIHTLVQSVFAEVLTEFRGWKVKYCEDLLSSLSYARQRPPVPILVGDNASLGAVDSRNDDEYPDKDAEQISVAMTSYSHDGSVKSTCTIPLQIIHCAELLEPHPPYESCSPISRNIFTGDDDDRMPFIPYADDATFDHVDHTLCYGSLAWEKDYDPDLEVVSLEAAYRLHTVHDILYQDIDSTGVLPFPLFSIPGIPGLFTQSRRRDLLTWRGSIIPISFKFPCPSLPASSNLPYRIERLNELFCPHLNCIESLCAVDVDGNTMSPPSRKPTIRLSKLLERAQGPCEAGCFLHDNAVEPIPRWSEDDINSLKTILEIEPNMIPCDHAELCFKPCHEVLYYRKLLLEYPDSNKPEIKQEKQRRGRPPPSVFLDDDPLAFTPNNPCDHSGPCGALSECICFKNKTRCRRNCRCPAKCGRRWKGCCCAKARNGTTCLDFKRCPCVDARRECDPELCLKCGCRIDRDVVSLSFYVLNIDEDPETTVCGNSQIQYGHFKEVEVKRSRWGLGAFLVEKAKEGDLITEYVGEIIYELTFDSRGEVATHRKRSYVFGLNKTTSLDSSCVGNSARFVDHVGATSSASDQREYNCRALAHLVNAEHRIGIFASKDMDIGTEILIDYGPAFSFH